jgi:hypothetical protein
VNEHLARAIARVERRLLAQVLARLDVIEARLEDTTGRLDDLQTRAADAEALTAARVASTTEQMVGVLESDARMARRFEEIERILGAAPPGTR